MTGTWEDSFRAALARQGYVLDRADHDPADGWSISYSHGGLYPGAGEFEARSTTGVISAISSLPVVKHPDAAEVLWAAVIPLHAAAKVGKVHLVNPGSTYTLCGRRVPGQSKRFTPTMRDARCMRCEKIGRR